VSGKYGYEDRNGSRLEIRGIEAAYGCRMDILGDSLLEITEEAAPSVAQAIIAFSRAEATVVEGKLPEVSLERLYGKESALYAVVRDDNGMVCNWDVTRDSIDNARRCARDAMAVARAIEEYLDSEEHANKVLQERRDAIAVQLGTSPLGYHDTFDSTKRAIDRIIELEDKLGAQA
jgi:hypothetical protein